MFKRSFQSRDRAGKSVRPSKKPLHEQAKSRIQKQTEKPSIGRTLISPIITLIVGCDARVFACHEDVLSLSPFFAAVLRSQSSGSGSKQIELPDEEPEIFSSVLEYLYKGDYYPRLIQDKKRSTWHLEDASYGDNNYGQGSTCTTVYHSQVGGVLLKDSVVYCTAEKFGLEDLKHLSLRKQGLQTGIQVDVILRTARFAYENTPDQDAKLRAHFLALIIRSRKTFKRSGTMQMEMELGGSKLYFDLFVAMCNHVDDIVGMTNNRSPKTI